VAVRYLAAGLAIIACYLYGMVMTLFGPKLGWLPGTAAFIASVCFLIAAHQRFCKGGNPPIAEATPTVTRYRVVVLGAMGLCIAIFVAAIVAGNLASENGGVADLNPSVFVERSEYLLNNHGRTTPVSRTRHLVVGTSFVLAWHSFGILVTLVALHCVLYGRWPLEFDKRNGG